MRIPIPTQPTRYSHPLTPYPIPTQNLYPPNRTMTAKEKTEAFIKVTTALLASGHYTDQDENGWPSVLRMAGKERTQCVVEDAHEIVDEIEKAQGMFSEWEEQDATDAQREAMRATATQPNDQ